MDLITNCDLGENESDSQTRRLMALIDAANIGCGVHAGSEAKTRATIGLAQQMGVKIGAHPGLGNAGGRGEVRLSAGAFRELLDVQVGCFLMIADTLGAEVYHLKLHGSLYHAVEVDGVLRGVLIDWLLKHPDLVLLSLAGGTCLQAARAAGVTVLGEIFADRGYREDGSLVPRGEVGALIEDVNAAVTRLKDWQRTGRMRCVGGGSVELSGETVCVHSDSPHAVDLLEGLSDER